MNRRAAFTLIELLVVIAIIAVLIGLLMPAVQKVRESANRAKCINNMKQLVLGLTQYENKYGAFPAQRSIPPQKRTGTMVHILPFIEQDVLFNQYDLSQDWFLSPLTVLQAQPPMFLCPSNPSSILRGTASPSSGPTLSNLGVCDYAAVENIVTDPGQTTANSLGYLFKNYTTAEATGLMGQNTRTKLHEVKDGASNTIAFAEDTGRPMQYDVKRQAVGMIPPPETGSAWAEDYHSIGYHGLDYSNGNAPCSMNCNNHNEIYSFHTTGSVFGFADGSAKFAPFRIDVKVVAALITRAGGETASPDF